MTKTLLTCVALAALLAGCGKPGGATDPNAMVQIDGSSTVFPISEALGEEFQRATGNRVTVGLSGTGGGFKKLCRGESDISGASRPIRQEEIDLCAQNGVEYIELPVALDALATIVNPGNTFVDCLTTEELRRIWAPESQGQVTRWNQVRASFPDQPLGLFGAGTDSGTFDYYTAAINGQEGASRGDYTATEDDNVTVTGVAGDTNALGYLGLAYLTENAGRVKAVPIRQADGTCVAPSAATARDASYQPLSRPLFFYVSRKAADEKPQLREFIHFAFSTESEALVAEVGYVPLPVEAYTAARGKFDARRTGTHFGGHSKIGVTLEELLADASA